MGTMTVHACSCGAACARGCAERANQLRAALRARVWITTTD